MLHLRWACRGIGAGVVGLAVAGSGSAADPAAGPESSAPAASAGADFLPAQVEPPVPAGAAAAPDDLRSGPLRRPIDPTPPAAEPTATAAADTEPFFQAPVETPLGFARPSGILPRDSQDSSHFFPMEYTCRAPFPAPAPYSAAHTPSHN